MKFKTFIARQMRKKGWMEKSCNTLWLRYMTAKQAKELYNDYKSYYKGAKIGTKDGNSRVTYKQFIKELKYYDFIGEEKEE